MNAATDETLGEAIQKKSSRELLPRSKARPLLPLLAMLPSLLQTKHQSWFGGLERTREQTKSHGIIWWSLARRLSQRRSFAGERIRSKASGIDDTTSAVRRRRASAQSITIWSNAKNRH
jgi:hypothetical protein